MNIASAFSTIGSDDALRKFLADHAFVAIASEPKWNLGTYQAVHAGQTLQLRYRFYDPSQAFSIQRDIHKAELLVVDANGGAIVVADISFEE